MSMLREKYEALQQFCRMVPAMSCSEENCIYCKKCDIMNEAKFSLIHNFEDLTEEQLKVLNTVFIDCSILSDDFKSQIKTKDDALNMICDVAVDCDGYRNAISLIDLIEELKAIAVYGISLEV